MISQSNSEVYWLQAGMTCDTREHTRSDLVSIMECKDVIGKSRPLQHVMRSRLSLD